MGLLVRVLDRRPHRGRDVGAPRILRRVLSAAGRQVGSSSYTHDLTGTGCRSSRRGLEVAGRGPGQDPTSTHAPAALLSRGNPSPHPHYLDDPPSPLSATRTPAEHRTSILRTRLQAPAVRLSYNFLYWFKSRLRSAPPGALSAPPPCALLPPARAPGAAPTRAHGWMSRVDEWRSPHERSHGHGHGYASGGGAPTPGWRGRRSRVPAERGVRGELPSRPPPTQAEPSSRGPGRQGRSYSGALHLDALNHARSTVCGSTADGMEAGVGVCLRWSGERRPDSVDGTQDLTSVLRALDPGW